MISYKENEAENEKHIDKTLADLSLDMDIDTRYDMYLSIMMVICIKQHLINI